MYLFCLFVVEVLEAVCTYIFLAEMGIKLLALGIWGVYRKIDLGERIVPGDDRDYMG